MSTTTNRKKLIAVALPLDAINRESTRVQFDASVASGQNVTNGEIGMMCDMQ